MSDYILGPDADLDLDDIWEYIAADSIDSADQWIAKLFDALEAIARMPGIEDTREDLTAHPVLFWPVGSYLVIYRRRSRGRLIHFRFRGARTGREACPTK